MHEIDATGSPIWGPKGITVILRLALGGLFLASCLGKIAQPAAFHAIVANYQVLPPLLVTAVAVVFPWVEAGCGLALIFGRFQNGAALLVCLMMAAFIGVTAFNALRGLNIACGCFSLAANEPSDVTLLILRDLAILAAAAWVLAHPLRGRQPA